MDDSTISKRVAPYGTWTSSLTASSVGTATLRLGAVAVDGDDILWLEGRPHEGGRNVVVRRNARGEIADVTPGGTNVRTRVHQYGGAAYVASGGAVYYSNFLDNRIYEVDAGRPPRPLTPPGDWYYADLAIDPRRRRLVCVREDHSVPGREPDNALVSVPFDGPETAGEIVASGYDFYSTPRFSPDGLQLAWLCWRHPQMPWDGTQLWTAAVALDGSVRAAACVAGGDDESIFQPGWSPDGILHFVSDRSGWWNLYRLGAGAERLHPPVPAEFGRPQWLLGQSTWAFAGRSRIVVAYQRRGTWRLATVTRSGGVVDVPTDLEPGDNIVATTTHVVFVGGSPRRADALCRLDLATAASEILRCAPAPAIAPESMSVGEPIDFTTAGGRTAYAFHYAPTNAMFTAPPGTRPPLIVIGHGGPTASTSTRLNQEIQYWTTRGFAVVDVNYRGSSGYGRAYRRLLEGEWGRADVEDCVNAARHLVATGQADPDRLVIRGRSAGGYTTLAAMTFHAGVFKAGASYYGVSDLEALARDTHKFESRYIERLVGAPVTDAERYRARSPIHFLDRLACPIILFQGLEDRVVPPNQSRLIADALAARGVPAVLLTFEGEQHGFRKAETIAACLDSELRFYGRVFGFAPDGASPRAIEEAGVAAP
jgi:dipeptidyl aminopeptidase/acylaminoacyl peptidase